MRKLFLALFFTMMMVGCGSTEKKVDEKAAGYEPVVNQDAQVERLISNIQNDESLSEDKKDKLSQLVLEQSAKVTELKKRQSQLRALLVDQLLASSDGSRQGALDTSKQLEEVHKESISGLNDFIVEFRNISGETQTRIHMRDMGAPYIW